MNKVQIGIIIAAVVLVSVAVLILTGFLPGLRNRNAGGAVTMWGFDDSKVFDLIFQKFTSANPGITIKYQKKDKSTFESELLNAIARGESPDIVIFPSYYVQKHKDKLSVAPSILFTEREITQQYVDASSIFLGPQGAVLGVPLSADALILYWNKDIFTQNFVTLPPANWDDFLSLAQKFTKKDASGNITLSGAALGRSANIADAPDALTALFLQSGDKIIDEKGEVVLGDAPEGKSTVRPAESALRFFSDFANPQKASQSWSLALPEARDTFVGGKLAMYIGYLSEYAAIEKQNSHLSFGVSLLPQLQGASRPITFGTVYALSVPKAAKNPRVAWDVIAYLTAAEAASAYAGNTGAVSVRRDVLPQYQADSIKSVFGQSAIALKLWLDPDPVKSRDILSNLIEDVALGRGTLRDAIDRARARFKE